MKLIVDTGESLPYLGVIEANTSKRGYTMANANNPDPAIYKALSDALRKLDNLQACASGWSDMQLAIWQDARENLLKVCGSVVALELIEKDG